MSYSLNALYRVVGISKQAVSQYALRQRQFEGRLSCLIKQADAVRKLHPGCGVEKLYYTLAPEFIGRDRFIETFMCLGYRLKRKRNYRITTRRGSIYYPNLIEGMQISRSNVVWQSDITYLEVEGRFYYGVFIVDVYTKQIVGYEVSNHMRASANTKALNKALQKYPAPEYHHSDRGSQYTAKAYTDLLKQRGTKLSMGIIAQENAFAERINGTIKNEFLAYWKPNSLEQLRKCVRKAVRYYNQQRPHNHLGRMAPAKVAHHPGLSTQPRMMTIFKYEHN